MSLAHGSSIVKDGLVLHLDAANVKSYPGSGLTVYDLSKISNNCAINGNVAHDGQSFLFNGVNSGHIDTNNTYDAVGLIKSNTNPSYTLDAWIYLNSALGDGISGYNVIGHSSDFGVGLNIMNFGGGVKVNFGYHNTSNFYSTGNLSLNKWYNITCVMNSVEEMGYIYINGLLDSSLANTPSEVLTSPNSIVIGTSPLRITGILDGKISLAKIYNRYLSLNEIQQNFEALRGRYGI